MLTDGLGNQMFQYAYALAMQLHSPYQVMLDRSWFPEYGGKLNKATPRQYALGVYPLSLPFCQPEDLFQLKYGGKILGPIRKALHLYSRYFKEKGLGEHPHQWEKLNPPCIIRGFFQKAVYPQMAREQLLQDFSLAEEKLTPENIAMRDKIRAAGEAAVMVHIRRGDYLKESNICVHGICSPEYYAKAESLIAEKTGKPLHLFIFSDDPEWVKENYQSSYPITCVDINGPDEAHLDIYLMSQCSHAIIANSSFSWWGAWLIRNPHAVVTCPALWFADGRNTDGLRPEHWFSI